MLKDGTIASGSGDNTIKFWDQKTGNCLKTLTGHQYPIKTMALLGDGTLVSGGEDNLLMVWASKRMEVKSKCSGHTKSKLLIWKVREREMKEEKEEEKRGKRKKTYFNNNFKMCGPFVLSTPTVSHLVPTTKRFVYGIRLKVTAFMLSPSILNPLDVFLPFRMTFSLVEAKIKQ